MPLRIRYRSADDQVTERVISDEVPEPPNSVRAYCHLRKQERTFVLSRIEDAFDTETGTIVPDIWLYYGMPTLKPPSPQLPEFPMLPRSLTVEDAKRQRNEDKRALFGRFKLQVVATRRLRQLFALFYDRCFRCGSPECLELDHHVPQCLGGRLVPGNIVLLCRTCNSLKHGTDPECFYNAVQLEGLQPILEAELQLFDFRFDWNRWNVHPKEYLLSLGVQETEAESVLRSKDEGLEVRLSVSID